MSTKLSNETNVPIEVILERFDKNKIVLIKEFMEKTFHMHCIAESFDADYKKYRLGFFHLVTTTGYLEPIDKSN